MSKPVQVPSLATSSGTDPLHATLKNVFGFDSFRPFQEEIVRTIVAGNDVFAIQPTGAGKSLVYQIAGLHRPGLTVVISPLIALMKDQVDRLQAMGVAAAFLNSTLDSAASAACQRDVKQGKVKLLYVAPERLMLPSFQELLASTNVGLLVVDEAHCVSEWGHDFRPEYGQIGRVRARLPDVPLAAFTATATLRVQADIAPRLGLRDAEVFRGSFNRPNLYYAVRPKQETYGAIRDYIRAHPGQSGIIYCLARATTERYAERLAADGIRAVAYHAGLDPAVRSSRQEAFARDNVRIVVATIAFGMGIDHPSIRFVLHADLPKSLESMYQEGGRAGRDGEYAECVLFYSYADVSKQERFIEEIPEGVAQDAARTQLRQMVDWAEHTSCRRRALLAYFDEDLPESPARCCDLCDNPLTTIDCTIEAQKLLSAARRTGERFGLGHLIDVLSGSETEKIIRFEHNRLPTYGVGRDRTKKDWQHIGREIVRAGYLEAEGAFGSLRITSLGLDVLFKNAPVTLTEPRKPVEKAAAPSTFGAMDHTLFDRLRALRKRLADERGVPPYVVFHDTTLKQMATERPLTTLEMRQIQGVGDRKIVDYGDDFLAEITNYVTT